MQPSESYAEPLTVPDPSPATPERDEASSVDHSGLSGAIVCYARCYPCQFGEHDQTPHSWMGSEDRDHAINTGQIPSGTTYEQLTETHPCNCRCQGRDSMKVIR